MNAKLKKTHKMYTRLAFALDVVSVSSKTFSKGDWMKDSKMNFTYAEQTVNFTIPI